MRAALATIWDSRDIHAWSGSGYHMAEALREGGFELARIGPLRPPRPLLSAFKTKPSRGLTRQLYESDGLPSVCDSYARQVERALSQTGADLVVSPNSPLIARLRTDLPIVLWTDATFAGLVALPDTDPGPCRESIEAGNRMQREALSNCTLAVFASDWAAHTARRVYGVNSRRVRVVPFGANLTPALGRQEIETLLARRGSHRCTLLFVGVDWDRKGGDIAVETALRLRRRGLDTELHIVGCEPPRPLPAWAKRRGFVSKKTAAGRRQLDGLFRQAHFLILPTRSDCYGIVFAEASAYGVPSVGTDVGGTASAVRNGRNGQLFPLESGGKEMAEFIWQVMSAKGRYRSLALSSYQEYAGRLNWSAAGRRLRQVVDEACGAG